jgi:hypothetical protein
MPDAARPRRSAPSTTRRARQGRLAADAPRRSRGASHALPRIETPVYLGKWNLRCARLRDGGRFVLLRGPAHVLLDQFAVEHPRRAARLRLEVVDEHGEVHEAIDAAGLIGSGRDLARDILLVDGQTTRVASHEAAARFLFIMAELASAGLPRLLEAA